MFIDVSSVQALKASFPIVVTLFGMFIDVSAVQVVKAPFPIVVTLFGIFIDVSAVQLPVFTTDYYSIFYR